MRTWSDNMNDWRSKPRTGKAEFMKYADKINQRITAGDTQTQIYEDLRNDGIALSYSQFNRYVNVHVLKNNGKQTSNTQDEHIINKFFVSDMEKGDSESDIDFNEWNRINVKRKPLIERLVKEGFTPSDVESWGLSNESQISKKLNLKLMNRG